MKARVGTSTLKRLVAVEQRTQGQARHKFVKLPKMLSIEAWEALAVPMQQALAAAAAEDIAFVQPGAATATPSAPHFGPIEGVHFHRADSQRNQAPVPKPPRPARAPNEHDEGW